jgi:predicted permease
LRELHDKIATLPGVREVSFSDDALPMVSENDGFFWIEGQPKPASASDMGMTLLYTVEPDYLNLMSIPLKQGRFFTSKDDERSTAVAVIDEAFARKYFPDRSPIGNRVHLGDGPPIEIVGVVGHVKQWGLEADDRQSLQAQFYQPFRALPDDGLPARGFGVVVRSVGDGGESTPVFSAIRRTIQSQNNQNVVSNVQTLNQVISESLSERRFSMIVLGSFAAVALLLASLGIYGVISYLVGQRTHELGIRLALGAGRRDILRLVLGHGMKMALAGVAIGLLSAFGLTRLMRAMLFGVGPTDPLTFGVITMVLTLVALVACYLPARRATKVDPLVALRTE